MFRATVKITRKCRFFGGMKVAEIITCKCLFTVSLTALGVPKPIVWKRGRGSYKSRHVG